MSKSAMKLLIKGDVIRTNPHEGFWGIAVVLSEKEKTPESLPMCHIAISPLIFQHKVAINEIYLNDLKPLVFERIFSLKKKEKFSRKDICIGVCTRRFKADSEKIGSIDSSIIYDGPLPFEPLSDIEIKWPLCGVPTDNLGKEAYFTWKRENIEKK